MRYNTNKMDKGKEEEDTNNSSPHVFKLISDKEANINLMESFVEKDGDLFPNALLNKQTRVSEGYFRSEEIELLQKKFRDIFIEYLRSLPEERVKHITNKVRAHSSYIKTNFNPNMERLEKSYDDVIVFGLNEVIE